MDKLTPEEKQMIIESLNFTRLKFENYTDYPSADFKQKRIEEVSKLIAKLKAIFKQ